MTPTIPRAAPRGVAKNFKNLGTCFRSPTVNLPTVPNKPLTMPPKLVPNKRTAAVRAGQKSSINRKTVCIFFWFSSSPNQSIIFIKMLPKIIFLMKSNILSKMPLTGFSAFCAVFCNTVNPASSLFSALLLLSLSADILSFSKDFSSNFCSALIVEMRSSSF